MGELKKQLNGEKDYCMVPNQISRIIYVFINSIPFKLHWNPVL